MLIKTVGVARYCYNWGLTKWNEMHTRGEKCNQYLLSRLWTQERPEWAKETFRMTQTKALLNLGGAFAAFYQGKKKHPVLHKKGRRDSFYLDNAHTWISKNNKLHIPRVGDVRMAEKLRFQGKILRYIVSRKADAWFVGISVELDKPFTITTSTSVVGVDVGSIHWAVTSEKDVLDRPKSITHLMGRLKHYQRRMSRRQKGSKNREKARTQVARLHQRIVNAKYDAVHKFTSRLAKNHGIVCCENLNIQGMQKRLKHMGSAIWKSCMGKLRVQLAYKANHYVEVQQTFPSSKRCSRCGAKRELTLDTRVYTCPSCGLVVDRDINAAINIRNEGLRIFTEGHSGSACGGC